jgi:5-formyltetrahydrofolate cyclo-ligase
MTKNELRKTYLKKREALGDGEYLQLNRMICENFFLSADLSFVKVLHTFLPMVRKKEVDTWMIIERIRREFPHISISIPKVNNETQELDSLYFEGLHQLMINSWGTQEPKQGVPTEPEKIDMVLVPLLVFDKHGIRVGYGKGYYDKFLATCKGDCKKVGVSFFDALEEIPREAHDVKLDYVVMPDKVSFFN